MDWQNKDNQLTKSFLFQDFKQALVFTNQIGEIAEKLGHHPSILLTWGKVVVQTTTHDQGNQITDKDLELVELIDKIALT